MARPRKFKRVCCLPEVTLFGPLNNNELQQEDVCMTVEEYEVIRMMDYEGHNQEECAKAMGVARSTIQRIYDDARKKIADSLINGKSLKIQGGDYKLCSEFGEEFPCKRKGCHKRSQHLEE
ncbi:MAG: hypothetical protein CVV02_07635 [Firmicutes bacterium HGW-Firmicutes-7]|nr:MAG: hypothetical protein CVV02_07635 [Firmicutes bacterium HGW-Firmicutes-7]